MQGKGWVKVKIEFRACWVGLLVFIYLHIIWKRWDVGSILQVHVCLKKITVSAICVDSEQSNPYSNHTIGLSHMELTYIELLLDRKQ